MSNSTLTNILVFVICKLLAQSQINLVFFFFWFPLMKLTNQKKDICRHRILYPLRLEPPFLNDARALKFKAGLELN